MSEYQYYEFLALDRPLTEKQRAEQRSISTRAEITAMRFANEYQWGDLKGDPVAPPGTGKTVMACAVIAGPVRHTITLPPQPSRPGHPPGHRPARPRAARPPDRVPVRR